MTDGEFFVIVDDEEDLLRSLVSALRRSRPHADVREFADPVLAAAHLERAPRVDVLITDIRMPKLDGIDLLVRARRRRPRLPAIIMTAFFSPTLASKVSASGTVEYLDKPFPVAAFLAAIERVLRIPVPPPAAPGFAGALAIEGLPDLVQLCALSNATSALIVRHGTRQGTMWFERGAVVHAEEGGAEGEPALYEILSWDDGEFAVERGAATRKRTIYHATTELLMEATRRRDESRRGDAGPASLDELDELDVESAIQEFDEGTPATATVTTTVTVTTKENGPMPNVQANLERLRGLDGYLGSALVDSESGMTLGTDGTGGGLNLEVAAAGNTEVVRAKRKAMRNLGIKDEIEDILITLGKQYHVIRPLRARGAVFYYVVLDRARSNLAMARMGIADTEKSLEI